MEAVSPKIKLCSNFPQLSLVLLLTEDPEFSDVDPPIEGDKFA